MMPSPYNKELSAGSILQSQNLPYCLATAALFVMLKFAFTIADNNALAFLLAPTDRIIGIVTGSTAVSVAGGGYFHEKINILIDRSCSGFNFWVLCFLVLSWLAIKHLVRPIHKILAIPFALIVAYLLTIFVNASRILASIVVQQRTKQALPDHQHLIHEAVGIITNLFFLVISYYLVEQFFITKTKHEKLTQS